MRKLFAFIAALVQSEAYCTVKFRLWKGQLKGPIEVETQYLSDTLPDSEETAKLLADAMQGRGRGAGAG